MKIPYVINNVQEIESAYTLRNRSERLSLPSESQSSQDVIDAVLFCCYGLSDDDAQYIKKQLEEML